MKNATPSKTENSLKVKTNVRAGGFSLNHNQTLARGMKVKTNVRAGGLSMNHNQTLVRD